MNNAADVWVSVLRILKDNLETTDTALKAWFSDIEASELRDDTLVLVTPTEFKKETIERNYTKMINDALFSLFSVPIKFELRIKGKNTKTLRPEPIYSEYTFDKFIVGSSNKFAHAAAQAVANQPGQSYNPLLIHGESGLGKTHLLYAIANTIKSANPDANIVYIKSEDFTNELIDAIKGNTNSKFREKYRQADVLLIDDIQFIAGKDSTQEEFFHTFNALYQNNKHIVITSDRPPKELYTLEDRLKTRFECGGIYDINPPDFETRIAILKKKADQIGIEIPDEIYNYIAEKITSNIRELEGAIKMIMSYHNLMGKEITLSLAEEALKDYNLANKKEITPQMIASKVEKYCNLKENELKSADKSKRIAYPRQIAMYLMKEMTNLTLVQIGDFFGGKDHSTINHGINKIKKDIDSILSTKSLVDNIIKDIKQ